MEPYLHSTAGGCELQVHIQPGASRSEIVGLHGDALKIRIASRPVEGAANAALLDFVANMLGIGRREVKMLRGEKSRRKTLGVALSAARAEELIAQSLAQGVTGKVGEHS